MANDSIKDDVLDVFSSTFLSPLTRNSCWGEVWGGGGVKASGPLCSCDLSCQIHLTAHLIVLWCGLMFGQRRGSGNVSLIFSMYWAWTKADISDCVYSNMITTGHWIHWFSTFLILRRPASPGLHSGWLGHCHCVVTGTKSFQSNPAPLKLMYNDSIQIKF